MDGISFHQILATALIIVLGTMAVASPVFFGDDSPDPVGLAASSPLESSHPGPPAYLTVRVEVGSALDSGERPSRLTRGPPAEF